MNLFKKVMFGKKLIDTYIEIRNFLDTTHLTKEVKDDILIIKEALKRLGSKFSVFQKLLDIIF